MIKPRVHVPHFDFLKSTVCIVGRPKIGKTTFASKMGDKVLFLATEKGYENLSNINVIDINSWSDFEGAIKYIEANKTAHTTVTIDIFDRLISYAEDEIAKRNMVKEFEKIPFGAGYSACKKLLIHSLETIRNLGLGVVITTHEKEKTLKKESMEWTVVGTSIKNSYEETILGFCDIILYAHKNQKEERMLRAQPTRYITCAGDRSSKLPEIMPLDAKLVIETLKKQPTTAVAVIK